VVTIDNGVFTGTINGAQFAGVAASDGWTITTRNAPASNTNVVVDDDEAMLTSARCRVR